MGEAVLKKPKRTAKVRACYLDVREGLNLKQNVTTGLRFMVWGN